jgi:hypothetical protein
MRLDIPPDLGALLVGLEDLGAEDFDDVRR